MVIAYDYPSADSAGIVVHGARRSLLVDDLPFGSYEKSIEQAMGSAIKILKERGYGGYDIFHGRGLLREAARGFYLQRWRSLQWQHGLGGAADDSGATRSGSATMDDSRATRSGAVGAIAGRGLQ
ncbi:uncharacterized protein LOC131859961 [Cryptomeria japonica]|uniref:uncharacterized protein LOC131859961 n=1 Tax=Cryptomeria japonica TaxID=3369 RepID=UPI0027DA89C5|nr:uncharacterized protein LOC131859961 [Cryptomeria japonica]